MNERELMWQKSFSERFIPMKDKLYWYAFRFLRDKEEAMDMVQDLYLKLWRMEKQILKLDKPEAFAMRILRNACLDKLKGKREFVNNDELPEFPEVGSREENNYDSVIKRIRTLSDRLPEQQREIFLLKDFEAFDYEEIANITKLSINTIRVNLSRARKKIRELMLKSNRKSTEGWNK